MRYETSSARFLPGLLGALLVPLFSTAPARGQEGGWPGRSVVALETARLQGGHFEADLEGGGRARLTLSPPLQKAVEDALAASPQPFSAAAVLSVPDGRLLALAGRSEADPSLDVNALTLRPWAPAASVFKVVAAAALLQEGHLDPLTRVCYHGGRSSVSIENLLDLPTRDRACGDLAYGIGKSQNAIIAKLAVRHLRPEQLERVAAAFGFGQPIDFDAEVEPSEVDIPQEPLELARAAAGFWHSSLSVLHGALLAATVANRGSMPAAHIVDQAVDASGTPVELRRLPARRVLDPVVAERVGEMMRLTTSMGTARRSFRDRRGHPTLPISVAGKTGTLFHRGRPQDPALPSATGLSDDERVGYSWFIGFAPAERPRIAFAVLLGNRVARPLRAHVVARQVLAEYLAIEGGAKRGGRLLARR